MEASFSRRCQLLFAAELMADLALKPVKLLPLFLICLSNFKNFSPRRFQCPLELISKLQHCPLLLSLLKNNNRSLLRVASTLMSLLLHGNLLLYEYLLLLVI
jgi:hypothetical protein